jgi:hypothetical protein
MESYNSQPGYNNNWDNNYTVQSIKSANWYRAVDLASAFSRIKTMPGRCTEHQFNQILSSVARKLSDIPVCATIRFPDGPLDVYVCEERGIWQNELAYIRINILDSRTIIGMLNVMFNQLASKKDTIDRSKFETLFNLKWA